MINKSPAYLLSIIMLVMLFLSAYVYADNQPSFTKTRVSINGVDRHDTKSAKEVARQQLENALFGASFDQFFKYDLGVKKTTGIKVHSSLGLKVRSDETLLQFKMKF